MNPYELIEQGYDKANKEWLDRIKKMRAEIETKYGQCSICEYDSDYGGKWYEVGDVADILYIIDEYKYKMEDKMIKKFLLNLKLWYMIKKCEYSHRKWLRLEGETRNGK